MNQQRVHDLAHDIIADLLNKHLVPIDWDYKLLDRAKEIIKLRVNQALSEGDRPVDPSSGA